MFNNAVILVTGGTGSWGYELIRQLLTYNPKKVIVFSRNEDRQVKMRREIEDQRLLFCIGDIRDRDALFQACKNVDYVFHLAALKHVPICEESPLEAIKTNIIGSQNVIDAAIFNEVKKVINVSTDKAADPSNFYGFTKAIAEKLMVQANQLTSKTKFVCVRGGNVLGTNGSVLHLFIEQINKKNELTITDKRMTRFFLTPEDSVKLLLKAAVDGKGGEILVMNMPACEIIKLAEVLIDHYEKEVKIIETGSRPGEKLYEVLIAQNEIERTVAFNEDFLVVLPTINILDIWEQYANYPKVGKASYNSMDNLMTHEEIKEMLAEANFLNDI